MGNWKKMTRDQKDQEQCNPVETRRGTKRTACRQRRHRSK